MRTIICDYKPKRHDPAAAYWQMNAAGSRAVRNTANFLIRNTMTGLVKSPEERTPNETEALHHVFTGIQKANALQKTKYRKKLGTASDSGRVKRPNPVPYPTKERRMLSYRQLDAVLKHMEHSPYRSCTSQVNQQALKKTVSSWGAYFKALADWKQDPGKYKARPRIPGYIRTTGTTAHYTSQIVSVTPYRKGHALTFIGLKDHPVSIGKLSVPGKLVKLEVKPMKGIFRLYLTFEDDRKTPEIPGNPKRIMGIDPGLDNFMTCVTNTGSDPFIIDGKWLKSGNQWFNKEKARRIGVLAAGKNPDRLRQKDVNSRYLERLSLRREHLFRDFFYKAAHRIFREAVREGVEVIVFGHNKGQKQEVSMGTANNQNFVSIPYDLFLSILKTVSIQYRIPVIVTEESYTSKASILDLDGIPVYRQGAGSVRSFSGKRITRGLYRSVNGVCINADVNGAANIIRKRYPDAFDGMALTFLTGTVRRITRDQICYASGKQDTCPENRKSSVSHARHEFRKERRLGLITAFGAFRKEWNPAA